MSGVRRSRQRRPSAVPLTGNFCDTFAALDITEEPGSLLRSCGLEAGLIKGEIEGTATCYCLDETEIRWLKDQIEGWLPGCCER